jgi:hypothetical protein
VSDALFYLFKSMNLVITANLIIHSKLLLFIGLCLLINTVLAFQLDCDYSKDDAWAEIGKLYYCNMQSHATDMTADNRGIKRITGTHQENKNGQDVKGFWNQEHKMDFFPSNLQDKFRRLIAIGFDNCGISKIQKEDLKPFGARLKYFRLSRAKLEVIDKDLFIYNPNLKLVGLHHNKIKQVGESVFDYLKPLNQLWLTHNQCVNKDAEKREDIAALIKEVKEKCTVSQEPVEKVISCRLDAEAFYDSCLAREEYDLDERISSKR